WGITQKLPSFYILFPRQEYRDIQTFGYSYGNTGDATYIYYTQPFRGCGRAGSYGRRARCR
ncbi:MAG: hypothetical protein II047_09920, partial [Bacteroidales bacterium]|nr:hypothetical protein [Bacteroidales bacterium]